MGKRGFQPGTMIRDDEWKENISKAHRKSRKMKRHLMRLHVAAIGRKLPATAQAASAATLHMRSIGLRKEDAPELWERYQQYYLKRQAGGA